MTTKPPVAFTQEMRFAIVMYGGSSLCIYMNGVAQELLRLVRATAPDPEDKGNAYLPDGSDKLGGSGKVYRQLGRMLSRGDNSLSDSDDQPIRTRFVIDVLSGTSAGGINAVYLAKALANDQDLESLKKLWIETADMDILMNDNQSSESVALAAQKQPRSLLNSRLMYYLLLDSLGDMDRQKNASGGALPRSPYVDELDLYVTATDIVGRKIRLRLADTTARERRHLNMFHFHCIDKSVSGKDENDFKAGNNPFLAFAARCTSAHPVPFEPVTLSDIDEALKKLNLTARSDNKDWQTFYEEYLQPDVDIPETAQGSDSAESARKRLADEFRIRPFNDGGILDNSPFSFAIDSLQFRHSDLPVDRKLLYIEPVPEHPELEVDSMSKPDALTTGLLSLSVLPRYQFIREDLERILERNRLIERVQRILKGIERDEIDRLNKEREEPLTSYEFGQKTLRDMIKLRGSSWGGYQRLRVAETTDDLVEMIARAAGFDDKSDEILAISYLVRVWRTQNYDAYGEGSKGNVSNDGRVKGIKNDDTDDKEIKDTENVFLFNYDLKWRIRRLKFVLKKIDEISCFDDRTKEILSIAKHLDVTARLGESGASDLVEKLSKRPEFREELRKIKEGMSEVLRSLLIERRKLLSRPSIEQKKGATDHNEGNPLAEAIKALEITWKDTRSILDKPTDKAREAKAEEIMNNEKFKAFGEELGRKLGAPMIKASDDVKGKRVNPNGSGLLEVPKSPTEGANDAPVEISAELMARYILRYYYNTFDRYDMISYPILYATNVGEEVDTVEVFRISPEDAGHLVTDVKDRKRKLAGTSLGNFGAFFDKDFRRNDILWGRLDAAERIITALLSSVPVTDEKERNQLKSKLITNAQRAILAEEFTAEDKTGLRGLLGASLAETKSDDDNKTFRDNLTKRLKGEVPADLSKMSIFLEDCLKGTDPLHHFRDTYDFRHDIKPKVLIRLAGRGSRVFGKMLEGIADEHRLGKKRIVWVTRLMQMFWGLVEVAVPDSLTNLIYNHWLKLLYVFEGLLIVLGTLISEPVQQFGFITFGVTVALHVAVLILSDAMVSPPEEKKSVRRILKFALGASLLVPLVAGFIVLLGVLGFRSPLYILQNLAAPVALGRNVRTLLVVLLILPAVYALLWAIIRSVGEFRRPPNKKDPGH